MVHPLSREKCKPKAFTSFEVDGDEYVLGAAIGDGAIGIVRKATRSADGRRVAVKFLAPDPKYIDESAFDDVAARFRREGERGVNLNHPHLLEIHSYCANEGASAFRGRGPPNPFIVMEHVEGRTLESYIRTASWAGDTFTVTRRNLGIAVQVAEALDYLHQHKMVHRDVKPANVFLNEGTVERELLPTKLGDFGVVKWGDFYGSLATGTLTATKQEGLGTLKYMSPEQALAPKNVSVRSDIYSLGISLFELFSGRILASPHHVFAVMSARLSRGTAASRFTE